MLKRSVSCLLATAALHTYSFTTDKVEETVVIGTRTPQTMEDTLAPVTLITKDEIEKLQIQDMGQLLSRIPGVNIKTTGSYGSNASIILRGTSPEQTLVLINGQRMGSATLGQSAIQFIDPEQVYRIEVVRGARAALYGADAIGGVINIITQDDNAPSRIYLSAGYGTYNTQKYAAATSFNATDSTKIQINAVNTKSDGFDSTTNKTPPHDDDDPYENLGINLGLTQQLGDFGKVNFIWMRNNGEVDYDQNCFDPATGQQIICKPYRKKRLGNLSSLLTLTPTDSWHTTFHIARFDDRSKEEDHLGSPRDHFYTRRYSAYWQNDFLWATDQTTSIGLDYYQDSIKDSKAQAQPYSFLSGKAVTNRDNRGIFIQHQANLEQTAVQAAIRYDDNEAYGTHTTGNITFGIDLAGNMLSLSYATAYRAPTFNDLYYPQLGNPDLNPEKSRQIEIGLSGYKNDFSWQFSGYLNKLDDMIAWAPNSQNPPIWTPSNVKKAEIQGFEFVVNYQVSDIYLSGNYSYVDAVDLSTNKVLRYRPKNLFNLDVVKNLGNFDMGMTLLARSRSFTGSDYLAGYATVDVFAAYRFVDKLTAKLKFANLLNKDYVVNKDYNTAGITAFFTLTYDYAL